VNKKDSASHYYEYALKHKRTNEWQRKAIYQRLSAYAEEQGQFQKAYFYLKMADRIQDTLYNQYEAERIRQAQLIQTYRNASKKKYQNAPNETEEKPSSTFPIGNLVTIGLLGIGAFVAFHYRRKKQTDYQQPETNDLHKSAIYQLIKSQAHKPDFKLTDEQWQELQTEIDKAYNNFTARLYAKCPKLNETELHVCYLLKLKVSPTDIAHIIMRQVSTVSGIRKRLYEKIHGVKGNAKQLDDFISKF
jgi:DNA-binding CsgD family transcriptional regulator